MRIAYITGDVQYNRNFAFFHDLLVNFPIPSPSYHKVCCVAPNFNIPLVETIKNRGVYVDCCMRTFQLSTDMWWNKIRDFCSDCDVVISGNITNLDDVLHPEIDKPLISVSLAERYFETPGSYGNFHKDRFNKVAISNTARLAFPEYVRDKVKVIYPGIDPSRLTQKVRREDLRNGWFPGRSDDLKLILFVGERFAKKGLAKVLEALERMGPEYKLLVASKHKPEMNIPRHLFGRVVFVTQGYDIGDIYLACDCVVLPTEHEGMSTTLLEAWYLNVPTVTTRHTAVLELMSRHPDTDFGTLLDVDCEPKDLIEAIHGAYPSTQANSCVLQHYMSNNLIEEWGKYLEEIV